MDVGGGCTTMAKDRKEWRALVHKLMIECDSVIFCLVPSCVRSNRPPALWWLITRRAGGPLHDALGVYSKFGETTDIKAQVPSI